MINDNILEKVRQADKKRILFLPHTIQQMSRPDRMITTTEVEKTVIMGELIEDYLAIITAYLPHPNQWSSDFKRRL